MKHLILFFTTLSFCCSSYAQISREADREFKHFGEVTKQTKEYKETDSLLGVYNHNRKQTTEMRVMKFEVSKGYGKDEMQYLYGAILSRGCNSGTETTEYYLKYDKGKRKITAISKAPLP